MSDLQIVLILILLAAIGMAFIMWIDDNYDKDD